jgi:hypothetical protein
MNAFVQKRFDFLNQHSSNQWAKNTHSVVPQQYTKTIFRSALIKPGRGYSVAYRIETIPWPAMKITKIAINRAIEY